MDSLIIRKIIRRSRTATLILSDRRRVMLDNEVLFKAGLGVGEEITYSRLENLSRDSAQRVAADYALYLLSRRNYSSGLLRRKLIEKGQEPRIISTVIANLTAKGFLDDRRYARRTAESILARKPAGKKFLTAYLRTKLIPRTLAEEVVDEVFQDEDETALALRLLQPRLKQLAKFELETARTKAYNYLSRRAISYRAAKEAFEILRKEMGN